MKKITLVLSLLIIASLSHAIEDRKEDKIFLSIETVKQWAEKSSFGGYFIKEFEYKKSKVIVVFRTFTSGVKSSDASIFVWNASQRRWERSFYKDAIQFEFISVLQEGEQLIFRRDSDKAILFSVSLEYLNGEKRLN